jgi:heme exporter protein D
MHWASFRDFLAMGGYGLYIWSSFGLTLLCLCGELWMLRLRRLDLLKERQDEDAS